MGLIRAARYLRANAIRSIASGLSAMISAITIDSATELVFGVAETTVHLENLRHLGAVGLAASMALMVPATRSVLDDIAEDGRYDGPGIVDDDPNVSAEPELV